MAINQRLTDIVQGRVIKNANTSPTEFAILFTDDSIMKVRMSETIILQVPEGVRMRKVQERNADFVIECEDDTVIDIHLSEPGNSVRVHDKDNRLEYAG
jgi:hypothetical protein